MYFTDIMAEAYKEEFEIKEEKVSIKEEIHPSSTVEETCTVNLYKDEVKIEYIETHGKFNNFYFYKIMANVFLANVKM